mgnify:CR=1 FL=1
MNDVRNQPSTHLNDYCEVCHTITHHIDGDCIPCLRDDQNTLASEQDLYEDLIYGNETTQQRDNCLDHLCIVPTIYISIKGSSKVKAL